MLSFSLRKGNRYNGTQHGFPKTGLGPPTVYDYDIECYVKSDAGVMAPFGSIFFLSIQMKIIDSTGDNT